jgi:NAD(P)-dependent dehydrogenase (short-subunit alcohol dehydrogenase family)
MGCCSDEKKALEEKYMGKIEGKIVLVPGGSSGIGFATAKQFVNDGAYDRFGAEESILGAGAGLCDRICRCS